VMKKLLGIVVLEN